MWRILFILSFLTVVNCHPFKVLYSWNKLDYNFPNESMREAYIKSGDFIQKDNLPTGVAVWRDKMFITVPRWKYGVPSNLNYISMSKTTEESPKLTAYPSWEANYVHSKSNDVIINICRIRIDECDRLWGVDVGFDDVNGENKVVRPPRLIVIDLKTDKIIRIYPLKDTDMNDTSFFGDLIVDSDKDSCDKTYAYLSDVSGFGLVVYSWSQDNSWRFDHPYFNIDPKNSDFSVSGINFKWADGVFGLALTPSRSDGSKTLYFHALCGIHEYSVPTTFLKDERNTKLEKPKQIKVVGNKGALSQGTSSAMDRDTGIIYLSQVNKHGIACWDTHTKLNSETLKLIVHEDEKMAFPSDFSVDQKNRVIYALMSNLPRLMYNKMVEKNTYYVYKEHLDTLNHYCSV